MKKVLYKYNSFMKNIKMTKNTYKNLQEKKISLEKQLSSVILDLNFAREKGDLSENGEYTAAKASKINLEQEISIITRKLLNSYIVEEILLKDFITFGNTVNLEDLNEKKKYSYTILGEEETDLSKNIISCESNLGKNLLGKKIGEIFLFETPNGIKKFFIESFFIKKEN